MELQLLLILAVAFIVFGPEKMLEFATQLGRFIRKIRSEWAQIQMELQAAELREQLKKQTLEGEDKVKKYLLGENENKPKTQKEFLERMTDQGGEEKKELTMEDLFSGNAPVVEEEKEPPKGEDKKNQHP